MIFASVRVRFRTTVTAVNAERRPVRFLLQALPLALVLTSNAALADTIPIEIVDRGTVRIFPDGRLGEWRRLTELIGLNSRAQIVSGADRWTGEADASVGFALARDDQYLYVAAEVRDDQIVRTREHRPVDDALVISLGAMAGARTVGYDIAIYPGVPGSYAGAVEFRGARSGAVPGARVSEENLSDGSGFTIEAQIPWSSLPGLRDHLASLRGRVAYHDSDSPARAAIESVLATGPGDGRHYEQLPLARGATVSTATELINEFRRAHNLVTSEPFLERSGNIAGDAQLERVVMFPRYCVVAGPGIAGGSRYAYFEHPVMTSDDLVEVALRDVTGDSRLDVIIRARVSGNDMTREILYVYAAESGADHLERVFAHELSRSVAGRRVVNRATYEQGPRIRVTFGSNEGFTEQNFPRVQETDVMLPLLAWGPYRSVAYRWQQGLHRFEIDGSEPNPQRGGAQVTAHSGSETTTGGTPGPTVATAPSDLDGVLALARQRLNLPAHTRPDLQAEGNVAEDRQPEVIHVYGRTIVVAGRAFMSGRSYYSIDLPEGFTVVGLDLADVTDDGQMEALVRARRPLTIQVRGQQLEVMKEFLLVYSFDASHRGRVFAAEVARRMGDAAIVNEVRGLARGRGNGLTIAPGRATGWTEQNYPFRDTPPQGFAPLLLPWATRTAVHYRWNGQTLAP
jgi:hypothetical protein